jgi:hypothetical protein
MRAILFCDGNFSELSVPTSMNGGIMPDGSVTAGWYTDMTTGTGRGYLASAGAFLPFDFPVSISTTPRDMNPSGEVAGFYTDGAKKVHGFLLIVGDSVATFGANPQNGIGGSFDFASIDFPGAVATSAFGINSPGDVVGSYVDAAGKTHGFFASRRRPDSSFRASGAGARLKDKFAMMMPASARQDAPDYKIYIRTLKTGENGVTAHTQAGRMAGRPMQENQQHLCH